MTTLLDNAIAKLLRGRAPQTATAGNVANAGVSASFGGGTDAQMRAYGQSGWLFSVVDRIGTAVAAPDWKLYRKAGSGGRSGTKGQRQEIERHPALDLWNRPNPFVDRGEFIVTGQQHMDLVGEKWWHIVFSGRTPVELWVLRPDRMRPVPHPTEFIAGYEYRVGGRWEPLDREEVVFARDPNPFDAYRGLGRVQSFLVDIGSERMAAEWTRNFFYNGAKPAAIIEFPEQLSDPEYEKFVRRMREQLQGVNNAHRTFVLEGAKFVDVKYSQRDMQFNDLRKLHRDIILGAFGISQAMLGITESVNRANAEAGEVMFSRWLVVPRLRRIRSMLNTRIAPLFGDDLEFDYVDPTPENQELELEIADRGFKAGFLTRNEARLLVNLDEQPGGDKYIWELQPQPPAPAALPAPKEGDGEDNPAKARERIVLRAADDPLLTTPEERAEGAMRRAWERRLAAEADGLAALLENKAVKVEASDLDGWDWDWWERYGDDVIEELARVFELAALAAEPNASVPLMQLEAASWARQRGAQLLRLDGEASLVRFTQRRVRELVAQAIENGDSLQALARTLRQDFAFSTERATTIARTESATALGQGAKRASISQGRNEKRWMTQGDDHVDSPQCASNAGQGWIKLGDSFQSGHDTIPAHPNCRCVVRYRTAPQVSDVDPAEGLEEDVAAAIEQSRGYEARCPQCSKLLVRHVLGEIEADCPRCKVAVAFAADGSGTVKEA